MATNNAIDSGAHNLKYDFIGFPPGKIETKDAASGYMKPEGKLSNQDQITSLFSRIRKSILRFGFAQPTSPRLIGFKR